MLSAMHQRGGFSATAFALDPLDLLPHTIDHRRLSASAHALKALCRSSDSSSGSDGAKRRSHSATHSCSDAPSTPSTPSTPSAALRRKPSIHAQLRRAIGEVISEEELQRKFTFGRLLGSGATSKVYSAMENATGREVAVKVFDKAAMIEVRRSMVADGEAVKEKAVHRVRRRLQKILSELELSKSLRHPNIIEFLGAYETSHRICIVHELVDGGDLLEHLLTHGKMNEQDAAKVFAQLLRALQYCHDRNIYHRDLKLENVLVTKDFRVKLIDFGLSEYVAPGETLKTICGTPLYCSPEVLFLNASTREHGFAGGPADVWSVGILIFALLTGCAPFDDSTFAKLRLDVHRNRIAYPSYLSNEVKGLLKTLLIHDPHLRPTVEDILDYPWIQRGSSAEGSESATASPAASPRGSKTRAGLAGSMMDYGSDTTASTSGSYDGDACDAARAAEVLSKITEEPHDDALPTHLSCLEKELEHLVATHL